MKTLVGQQRSDLIENNWLSFAFHGALQLWKKRIESVIIKPMSESLNNIKCEMLVFNSKMNE